MKKAIVLVSGGLDSLITVAIAKQENDEIYFLHINYGQRTEQKELDSFREIVNYYKPIDAKIVNIDYIKDFGGNSLTDIKVDVPINNHIQDLDNSHQVPNTYVPFRNGNMIGIATAWAEVINASKIYIGAVEVDGSGYPDCKKSFFEDLEQAINSGTKDNFNIQICTPIIDMSKSQALQIGQKLGVPFELSWSCYQNNDLACGKCDSCYLRIKAFKEARLVDPIPYKVPINWIN
ncbi:MAG: 7-cyano-7-deazaguanine synthase QueC [Candidatus Cloacimonetes bacterium]|jgi:7-cyano-7-deazaguanine synthase|nr:7-cyano-7-deazaguanine synthase QueC [Candidatus Cloacimonadota bacterium]MDD4157028.1 7-cyano-7-deazaguanine synthase QueC [Candidatus Cloacimonadota bacterium]